jgi:hypothetical protein
MKKAISIIAMVGFLGACTNSGSGYTPITDYEGSAAAQPKITCVEFNKNGSCAKTEYTPARNYNADLNACRGLATQVSPVGEGAKQAGIGALVGAAGGAAIGAILGKPGTGAAIGAVGGGIGGAARGGMSGTEKQEQVVRDCMRGRGWNSF